MRNTLITLAALCISCTALANNTTEVLCPASVTCTQTNHIYACTINGSSTVSWQFNQAGSDKPDTGFPIRFAAAWFQNGKVSCQYAANPGPGPSGYAIMYATNSNLKPDTSAPGNKWDNRGYCSENYVGYQPGQCPLMQ